MILPEVEKMEIMNQIRNMMDEFLTFSHQNEREQYFKVILDYLLTKPLFLISYPRFKQTVLQTITRNKGLSGGFSPNLDYDYYHSVISGL